VSDLRIPQRHFAPRDLALGKHRRAPADPVVTSTAAQAPKSRLSGQLQAETHTRDTQRRVELRSLRRFVRVAAPVEESEGCPTT
jgi:hypothetical protein